MTPIAKLFFFQNLVFRPFLNSITNIVQNFTTYNRAHGVLGIQTLDRIMVGADETTELWRSPRANNCSYLF